MRKIAKKFKFVMVTTRTTTKSAMHRVQKNLNFFAVFFSPRSSIPFLPTFINFQLLEQRWPRVFIRLPQMWGIELAIRHIFTTEIK
jgi:hypothetical protein